jgi:mitochondrial fission protein ELM1
MSVAGAMPGQGDRPLRVWVLSDGRPGHFNQAKGIVSALRLDHAVDERWIEVRLRAGIARNLLRSLLNHSSRARPLWQLQLFYALDPLPADGCDMIVSAGGKTSFANAWLAAVTGVPNIFSGSLRRLSPDLFTVTVTPQPVAGARNNIVPFLPPSAIDFARLQERTAAYRAAEGLGDQRLWTLLVGGDGAGYRFRADDWRALAALTGELARRHGIRWLIATSRRTGAAAERLLRRAVDDESVFMHCWSGAGEAYDPELYPGLAERVFVTEDSMTMLTEAMVARRPVYSLRPRRCAPQRRYEDTLRRYVERGILRRHDLAVLLADPLRLEQDPAEVLESSPVQALADNIRPLLAAGPRR